MAQKLLSKLNIRDYQKDSWPNRGCRINPRDLENILCVRILFWILFGQVNPDFMFSLFGPYLDLRLVYSNYNKCDNSTFLAMAIKGIHTNTWLLGMTSEKWLATDELFALCEIYHRHAIICPLKKRGAAS